MKSRLNKFIKDGVVNENEVDSFIKTLIKLSSLKVIPSKPKKVLKRLGIKKYATKKNKIRKDVIINDMEYDENIS